MQSYGLQIGKKFTSSGAEMPYMGNTVVSDLEPDNPAYPIIADLRETLFNAATAHLFIFLPPSSYHMTVIRGVNDLVRTSDFWPRDISENADFSLLDERMRTAFASVPTPDGFMMRFYALKITDEDVRISLVPATDAVARALCAYRNRIADVLNLRLPGHDAYTYHITIAYTLYLPLAEDKSFLHRLVDGANRALCHRPPFHIGAPYVAYYENMLEFSRERAINKKECK